MKAKSAFSGFSVDDADIAKLFYETTLELELDNDEMGLEFKLPGGGKVFIYQKEDHEPATYTVLNFVVDDIDDAVDTLTAKDVQFERYDNMSGKQDKKGILRGKAANQGPDIAWFKDPAGNVLSVIEESSSDD